MKLDAHQHFWKYNPKEYSWIKDDMSILRRDYLPDDLYKELSKNDINGSIVVQARQNIEESRWLIQLAEENHFIKGVVGWVDLCSSYVESQLEEFSSNPKFVGVRHVVQDEPDNYFMMRADFQHGLSLLSKYNLTYDLLIFPQHLEVAIELVKKFPDQKFVLDHIAKPDIKNKLYHPWNDYIKQLSKFQNVYCKLSGMVTEANWHHWNNDDFKYYIDHTFECFGIDRIMFGSDWPVCLLSATYNEVFSIINSYVKDFNIEEKAKIFGWNCANFYNII